MGEGDFLLLLLLVFFYSSGQKVLPPGVSFPNMLLKHLALTKTDSKSHKVQRVYETDFNVYVLSQMTKTQIINKA